MPDKKYSVNRLLTGLSAGTYSVLVSDKVNGCYDSAYATIQLKENILGAGEDAGITGVSMYPTRVRMVLAFLSTTPTSAMFNFNCSLYWAMK